MSLLFEVEGILLGATTSSDDVAYCYSVLEAVSKEGKYPCLELYVLCCEAAIANGRWDVAKSCEKHFATKIMSSVSMTARGYYCQALVRHHLIPAGCRGQEFSNEQHVCASYVIKGLALAVVEYPNDGWIVTVGLENLWMVVKSFFTSGKFSEVIDVVTFAVSLFDKLFSTNFDHLHVQWLIRYAKCCSGLGKFQESLGCYTTALDVAARLDDDRLYVQILRMMAVLVAERDGSSSKAKGEAIFSKQPIFQAIQCTQHFFGGYLEENAARTELTVLHEKCLTFSQERVKQEQTASRSKTKAPRGASTSEGMVISTAVMEEVISEVVLALALCKGTASTPTAVDLLLTSVNPRCKAFGMYAKAISWGYEREALDFSLATDLTYLTQSTLEHIKKCIHDIEVALDTARMIENDSERVYTLQVGCALLWLACLPLLQEPTIFHIRHTIKKMNNILKETTTNASQMRFSVELAYQSSVLEVEDDSLSKAKDCIQDALAKEYHVTLEDGRSVLPMDLPLMWLLHRADVRSKSGLFSNPEDEVLYNLEQVKLVSSASKRLVLIKAAFNKLPPLQDQEKGNEPEVNSKPEDTKHKPTKGASAKEKGKVSTVEPKPIHIRESLAYLYLSLLRECMKELSPSITPVALSVSKSLCDLDVPLVDQHKDLLLMKAEGHQCYAEVLLAESATEGEVLTTEMTTTITQNLLTASKIGCALSKMGFECAFIVMNACQKFLDLRQSTFSAGEFRSSRDLDELYEYFSQSILDFRHESKLTVELAFSFVLTLLGDYMESKDKDASWGTYEEFYQSVLKFPKSDSGSTTLKRALEVCQDTLQRLFVPSEKAPILSVYPTVCRLLGGVKVDHLHLPQELLLFQLGKICGPIGKEEKATAVSKDLLELLKSDPSVELCGRLAEHAFDMGIEQTVLDVCDIAEKLYKDGKLGWGTLYYPIDFSDKSTPVGNDKKVSLPARNPSFPKPSESDWSWYAKLLYFQAVIYGRRIPSMDFSSGRLLGLKVVQLCTNAAIATACGPAEMRSTSLKRIISFYHNEISRLRSIGVPDSEFVSSLKIIFSRTVLSNLRLATTNRVTDAGEDYLLNIVTSLGRVLLRGCAESNRLAEGVAIITSLQKILPTKYQSQISEEEVKARSQLSMPVDSTLRVAKSAGPEAEYTVWVALARTTTDPKQCENAWMCALKAVKDTPIARATCLCAYAEHLIRKGDVSCKQIKLFLLSAVDTVEHFGSVKEEETLATLPTEATGRNTLPRTLLGTTSGRTMLFSLLMGKTPIPVGKLRPVSTDPSVMLSELTIAVRAFYALFCISSDYSESDFPSKRDCVALILHYVQCMWRTVGSSLQKTNPDGEAPEDSAAPFPATWSGWCGHVVDASVVQLFTRSSREGSHTWSTDVMESIYLNVAEYLMEHKMEVFSFMILEWVKFSAALHHSPDHFKFHIVHRVANLYAQKACCLCALSAVASKSYVVEKPSAHFWASVEDGYSQIRLSTRPQEAKSERAVDMFSCSLHTLVLREAECWVYFGKTSLARLLVNATATLCRDIGDYESFCRCRTLTERMALYEHKPPAEEEDDEVLQNTPPSIWVELYLTKALHYLKSSRHVDLEGIFHKVKEVAGRFGQTDPDVNGVDDIHAYLHQLGSETIVHALYRFVVRHVVPMLRSGKFDPLIREAVDHLRKSKSCWERWDGLRASLMISVTQQDTDAINDDRAVFLTTALDSIDTLLTDVKTEAQRIGSLPPGCIPSACLEEAALLLWKAKFAGKNLFLIEGATQNYRMLSMDNLNLLKTNAPKELEDNVLQFMRDPLKKGGAESDLGVLQSSWFSPSPKVGDEVLNALQHFHISLREEAVRNCQRFYVQESAISSANLLQGKHYVNQCEALWINMQLAHQRLFELRAEAADFQQHAGKLSAATVEKVWQLFEEEFTAVPAADGGKSHKGKPRDDVPRLQSSNVNCNEALITQCFRTIVSDCLLRLDYASLSKVYLLLADLLALWNRYQAVGYAVEKAQAAALFAHLFSINRQHYASGKESVLVHTYASLVELDSGRLGSTHCSEVFAELLEESPLVAQAHASLAFPEKLDMMGDPLTECATLSIVRSPADERVMYVALRLPDGTLRTRRTVLDESGLLDWYKKYDRFLSFKHDEASGEEAVASFNLDELLEELDRLAAPLWGGLDSLIKSHGIKHTLYLCLDPCLQKYPLEQISSFSMFHSVARELSASTVAKKLTQKTTKTTGSSLFIIDPAGDCTNACDSIVNTETKQKSSNIITCKDSKYPVSDPFLVFSLGDKRCTSMYLHTDGDLRFVFTTPMIANVNLSHVQTCTIVSDGMSDAVQRREQRELLTCEGPLRTDQRWESYLLLLARGVRWLLANSLPSTSANNIALAKRVFSQISSGRGLETKESKAKDTKKQSMIVYGVQPTLPKKQ